MAPSTPVADVPVVDFSRLTTNRDDVAKQIVDGLRDVGFLAIKNVAGVNTDRVHRLCEWFFSLPTASKLSLSRKRWNPDSSKVYRGYFPNDPSNSSNKEAFEMGLPLPEDDPELLAGNVLYENPLWPPEDGAVNFQQEMCAYYELMHTNATEIMRLIATGLGQDGHVFDHMFVNKPLSTLRLLHYPPRQGSIPDVALTDDGKTIQCGDHSDSTLLTLLETFSYDGLEILDSDNVWKAVKTEPGTLVINIGDMLAQFTGGRLKATRHRVIDHGVDRYSVPFFLEPSYHADIGRPPLRPETDDMQRNMKAQLNGGKPLKYGHWLVRTFKEKQYVEYMGLESELKEL